MSALQAALEWAKNHKALIATSSTAASQAVGTGSWAGALAVVAAALSGGVKPAPGVGRSR